jgi:DNA-binding transcriptional ArsR family regulator
MESEMCPVLDRKKLLKSICSGQMIDLRSLVAFLDKEKWTELAITRKIDRVLGESTLSYPTVGKYVQMFVLSTKETNTLIVPESEDDFSVQGQIALVFSEEPFLSVRHIVKRVMMSKSTVYRHLAQTMRRKLRHLKWVLHILTESTKMNRAQRATKLLMLLK